MATLRRLSEAAPLGSKAVKRVTPSARPILPRRFPFIFEEVVHFNAPRKWGIGPVTQQRSSGAKTKPPVVWNPIGSAPGIAAAIRNVCPR